MAIHARPTPGAPDRHHALHRLPRVRRRLPGAAHGFPGDGTDAELSATAYTVVLDKGDDRYVRKMCMHCVDPSCASVCPVGAFSQDRARAP